MRPFHALVPVAAAFAALAVDAPVTAAEAFAEADLQGRFAFRTSTRGPEVRSSTERAVGSFIGVFTADGEGTITASRRWYRPPALDPESYEAAASPELDVVEQSLTGIYTVGPDGRGVMTLVAESVPPWRSPGRAGPEVRIDAQETIHFTLQRGTCELALMQELEGEEWVEDPRDGPVLSRATSVWLEGLAVSQESRCAPFAPAGGTPAAAVGSLRLAR